MADAVEAFSLPMSPSLPAPLVLQETTENSWRGAHGFSRPCRNRLL